MQTALPLRTASAPFAGTLPGRAAMAVAATAFVALCAHVSIPVFFTPVPFTLQPFAVILVGLLLGPAGAFAAMMLYLAEGAMGLPVFTPQGAGGVAQLLGPTAGFLFSYPLAAAAAGALARLSTTRTRRMHFALAGRGCGGCDHLRLGRRVAGAPPAAWTPAGSPAGGAAVSARRGDQDCGGCRNLCRASLACRIPTT